MSLSLKHQLFVDCHYNICRMILYGLEIRMKIRGCCCLDRSVVGKFIYQNLEPKVERKWVGMGCLVEDRNRKFFSVFF